jgi:hypothetical protein
MSAIKPQKKPTVVFHREKNPGDRLKHPLFGSPFDQLISMNIRDIKDGLTAPIL